MGYGWEIKHDYSSLGGRRRGSTFRRVILRLGVTTLVLGTFFVVGKIFLDSDTGPGTQNGEQSEPMSLALPDTQQIKLPKPAANQTDSYPFEPRIARAGSSTAAPIQLPGEWKRVIVQPGDNMSVIFGRLGLPARTLHQILIADQESSRLKRIKPGQTIRLRTLDDEVLELVYEQDLFTSLHILRKDSEYLVGVEVVEPERRVSSATGRIESSLFVAGNKAGVSDPLIMQLVEIFGWDIDFVLDVRRGDRFAVIFEEFSKDGVKVQDGAILAAEFVNRDQTFRAVRYTTEDGRPGYYADDGAAMKKAFLRTPVNFSRISSRFNLNRKHPVLNRIRAHKGVDYAAPHGTPIKATGDATVKFAGTKGGYGKVIELQHGGVYSTLYAHMSRFARGIRKGQRIRQGQTIGYVGKTGLATGPHLHYEFRVNGVHRNPLTVPLPKAEPLPSQYMHDFRRKAAPLLAQLDELGEASSLDNSVAQAR